MIAREEVHLVSEVCVSHAFLPDETERASGWLSCMLCSDDKPGSACISTFCKPLLATRAGGGTIFCLHSFPDPSPTRADHSPTLFSRFAGFFFRSYGVFCFFLQ